MSRSIAALIGLISFAVSHAAAQDQKIPKNLSGAYGIAVDSIHGSPLRGAIIQIGETGRQGKSDDKGYYHIDSIPPGSHRVALRHPLLDTLNMVIETKPIEFKAGQVPVLALATPSAATMVGMVCPKSGDAEASAALLGIVQDPDTRAPAIGAKVSLSWTEIRASKELGFRRSRRLRTVDVDSSGNYVICGLPSDLVGRVQATWNGANTAAVDISIGEDAVLALRSLGLGRGESVTDTVDGVVRQLWRGPAVLRGRVVGPDGGALGGARIEMPGTPQTATSSPTGAFTLTDAPVGTQAIVTRLVGYAPTVSIVELSAKTPQDVTVALGSIQVLPDIQAQAVATGLERVGFTDRQRTGMGRFLTHEAIEQRAPMVLTDIFTMVPGVRMTTDRSGNQVVESSRGIPGDPSNCTAVFVDRMQFRPVRPDDLVQELNLMVRPEQVWAMEVYQGLDVPGEFSTGQRCLTIVVWTRQYVGEQR